MEPTLHHWANQLAATPMSKWLAVREWVVVISQSVHIVMLSVVFGSALLINLRLLGVSASGRPVSALLRTLVPWMWAALLMLLATGVVQTVAEPLREFVDPAFWAKMAMLLMVVALTAALARAVGRNHKLWDNPASRPRAAIPIALISLALWTAIVFCGRFIGYTWMSYA